MSIMILHDLLFHPHLKLCGAGILGVGIWLRVEKGDYVSFTDYEFATASNLAIAAGAVIVIVTFLGVVGSIKENRILLLMVISLFHKHILLFVCLMFQYRAPCDAHGPLHVQTNVFVTGDYLTVGKKYLGGLIMHCTNML